MFDIFGPNFQFAIETTKLTVQQNVSTTAAAWENSWKSVEYESKLCRTFNEYI